VPSCSVVVDLQAIHSRTTPAHLPRLTPRFMAGEVVLPPGLGPGKKSASCSCSSHVGRAFTETQIGCLTSVAPLGESSAPKNTVSVPRNQGAQRQEKAVSHGVLLGVYRRLGRPPHVLLYKLASSGGGGFQVQHSRA